jgi:hypothetical protein
MPMLQASKSYPGLEGCTYISYLDKVTTKCPVYICNTQGAKVSEYFTFFVDVNAVSSKNFVQARRLY